MLPVPGQSESRGVRRRPLVGILLVVGVAALLLLAIWGAPLLPPPLRYGAWIGIALLPAINRCSQPCAYLFRKPRGGARLLNLGYLNKVSGWLIALTALIGFFWLILSLAKVSYDAPALTILQFGIGVFYIADTASKFIASRATTVITEKGIYSPGGTTRWEKIESRHWLNQHEDALLILKLKNRPWPLNEKTLHVPVPLKAEVDKILREKFLS